MSDCVFCKIIAGTIPAQKVYEDEDLIVIKDINPKAPVHLLVVPKKHLESVNKMTQEDVPLLGKMIFAGKKAAVDAGLRGWKMLFNVGKEGGQVVFHLHLHVLGGGKIDLAHT